MHSNKSMHNNPLKGKPNIEESQLPVNVSHQINEQIVKLVTHNAADASCLERFNVIKLNTQCVFAKKARIWGSKEWDCNLSLGNFLKHYL